MFSADYATFHCIYCFMYIHSPIASTTVYTVNNGLSCFVAITCINITVLKSIIVTSSMISECLTYDNISQFFLFLQVPQDGSTVAQRGFSSQSHALRTNGRTNQCQFVTAKDHVTKTSWATQLVVSAPLFYCLMSPGPSVHVTTLGQSRYTC